MGKKTVIYLIISVLAIGFLISKYNEYKEKSLDDILTHNVKGFKSIAFENYKSQIYNEDRLTTDKKEAMDELTGFLSGYQVKKMKDAEWNSDVSKEKDFSLDIYSENKPIMVGFYEERIHIFGVGYFRVINGPIDIEWFQSFKKKYGQ